MTRFDARFARYRYRDYPVTSVGSTNRTVDGAGRAALALRLTAVVGVVVLLAGPWIFDTNQMRLLTEAFCILVLATMWNLLAGYADIMSVGQHAFVGVGSYAFFGFTLSGRLDPAVAMGLAALVALAVALPTLTVIFRLRSAYLAIGTWVVAEVALLAAGKLPGYGGGAGASISTAVLRWFGRSAATRYTTLYAISLALALVATVATWALLRSAYGLGLKAMRDNEEAASAVGVNLRRLRTLCFLFTAPFLGIAGALIAAQKGRISPYGSFSITDFTVDIVFIVIIGGVGSLEGPIVGTILFFSLREVFSDYGSSYLILLGAISIAMVLVEPRGIWGFAKRHVFKADVFVVTRVPPARKVEGG